MFDIAFGGYLTQAVMRAREELAGRSHVDLADAQSEQLASELRKQFGLGFVRKDPDKGVKIKRPGFGGAAFEFRYYIKGGAEAVAPFAQSMALPRTRKLIAASAGAGAAFQGMPPHTPPTPHAPSPMPHHTHPGAQPMQHPQGPGVMPGAPMGPGTSFAGTVFGPGQVSSGNPVAGAAGTDLGMGAGMGLSVPGGGGSGGVGVQAPPMQQQAQPAQQTRAEPRIDLGDPMQMEMMRARFMPRPDLGALVAMTDGAPEDAKSLSAFMEEYLRSLNKDIEQANAQLGEALRQMCDGVCRQARAAVEMTRDKEQRLKAAGFEIE